jgi:diguanylate cyclase (GGDEF)-like protein
MAAALDRWLTVHHIRDDDTVVLFSRVLVLVASLLAVATTAMRAAGGERISSTSLVVGGVLLGVCILSLRRAWVAALPRLVIAFIVPLLMIWGSAVSAARTSNQSAGTAMFVGLPVLFAAYALRRRAAALITANAVGAAVAMAVYDGGPQADAVHTLLFASGGLVMLTAIVGVTRDQAEDVDRQVRRQAERDHLTGLLRRAALERHLDRAVGDLDAEPPTPGLGLLLVDVDHFKLVNDTHGHVVGDRVLTHIADVLRTTIRPGGESDDCRAPAAMAGRWGGDEFAVICPSATESEVVALAERVVAGLAARQFRLPDGVRLRLSVTIGVGHLSPGRHDIDELFRSADLGLYEAKRAGRGRVGVG